MPGCLHVLVVDEDARDAYYDHLGECGSRVVLMEPCQTCIELNEARNQDPVHLARRCLLCGKVYDRTAFLKKLERDIRDRYRLPSMNELIDDEPWGRREDEDWDG